MTQQSDLARVRKYKGDMLHARHYAKTAHDNFIREYIGDKELSKRLDVVLAAAPLKKIDNVGAQTALEIFLAVATGIAAIERGHKGAQ